MIVLRVRGSPLLLELSGWEADARESRYSPFRPLAVIHERPVWSSSIPPLSPSPALHPSSKGRRLHCHFWCIRHVDQKNNIAANDVVRIDMFVQQSS